MTAIAGFWAFSDLVDPETRCRKMLAAQRLYGQGQTRSWRDGHVAFGRSLFATLPEDIHDEGPVIGGGGRWALLADIRLDNREDLLATLGIGSGELLSDAAVAMRCIERWQVDAIEGLVGDFALALWDRNKSELLLARDYAGQRPLHYHQGNGFLAFASMPSGLHALGEVPMEVDSEAAAEFVAMLPSAEGRTLFKDIKRVAPGELCLVRQTGLTMRQFWSPSPAPLRLGRTEDYAEAVREAFDQAVEARLRGAKGAVATHLSGGLDSSAVTATAARLMASSGKVYAFTSVPEENYRSQLNRGRFADEGPHAAAVARLYPNVVHALVRTGGRSPIAELDRNFSLYQHPVVNLCNWVWGEAIADQAKARGLKVLLTGAMGNLSFSHAGFELLPDLLQRGRLWRLARELRDVRRNGVSRRALAAKTIGPFVPQTVWRAMKRFGKRIADPTDFTLIRPDLMASLAAKVTGQAIDYRPMIDSSAARLTMIQWADPAVYNKGALAQWGVDTRDPTADRRLFELCLRIPSEHFLAGGMTRALARQAFTDRLPEMVLTEQRKGYQAADWHVGLEADLTRLRDEVERIAACPAAAGTLDIPRMRALVEALPHRDLGGPAAAALYRLALLRGVSAGHFIRRASGD